MAGFLLNNQKFENHYRALGYQVIAGIDEAGRGPIAGPVVAAAVILRKEFYHPLINDSKQLTEPKREMLAQIIKENALAIGIGVVDNIEIDQINIYQATKKAMRLALEGLSITPEFILIDAMNLDIVNSEAIIKGDELSFTIAAASIIAKVHRDQMMLEYDRLYPGYGWSTNKGYGTPKHWAALEMLGPSPLHRLTYQGVVGKEKVPS